MEGLSEKKIPQNGHSWLVALCIVAALLSVVVPVLYMMTGDGYDNVAHAHGMGSETFPPVDLNGRQVSLEVSSTSSLSLDGEGSASVAGGSGEDPLRISVALVDFETKVTLRDVLFLIEAERGTTPLFEREFWADDGYVDFNFMSVDGNDGTDSSIVFEEAAAVGEGNGGWLGSLLGLGGMAMDVKGPGLGDGGLYKFDVSVLAADGYSNLLDEPLVYEAGISIPQTTSYGFVDPNFGNQSIDVITYYDGIYYLSYDPVSRQVSYFMPFEWSESNIEQTSVVHTELVVAEAFGDLLVSGFFVSVNGVELSEDVVSIDDFSDLRTIHFVILQKDLYGILESGGGEADGMEFVIVPDRDYLHLSSVTDNGQFRMLVSWEPENLAPGSDAIVTFEIVDTFLKNKPLAVPYEFSVVHDGVVIHEQSGVSTGVRQEYTVAEFVMPDDVSGIIHLNFENLDGNDLARTTIPVVADRAFGLGSGSGDDDDDYSNYTPIPAWFRDNAGWWASGLIDDGTFVRGIEFLVKDGIIHIPEEVRLLVRFDDDTRDQSIPAWIRDNAGWWASGLIDDGTFVRGIEFLIKNGVLRV